MNAEDPSKIVCVWRVSGADFDVEGFLASHPEIHPEAIWHRGRRDLPLKRILETSGFNAKLAEGATIEQVLALLKQNGAFAEQVRHAAETGAESEIDFGITVTISNPMASIAFSPEALSFFAELQCAILVSAYAAAEG